MCDIELSETDYNICLQAVTKCHLLNGWVKAGLDVRLNAKTFGFAAMTDDEEFALITKLWKQSELAWLKEQPMEI
jgi:hypothetical protein